MRCELRYISDTRRVKARRKELSRIADELENLRDAIDAVASEERDAYDNLPESLQESERGTAMEEAADELDDICGELDDLRQRIEGVVDEY